MASLVAHTSGFRSFSSRAINLFLTRKTTAKVGVLTGVAVGYYMNTTSCQPDFANDGSGGSGSPFRPSGFNWKSSIGGGGGGNGKDDPIEKLIEIWGPEVQKLGFGGVMGICTAVAVKRIGSQAAYAGGLIFLLLQGLAYKGYISIDFKKIQSDATKSIDANGDGKFDTSDLLLYWAEFKKIMQYNLPGGGGFAAGFALGLRYF